MNVSKCVCESKNMHGFSVVYKWEKFDLCKDIL